MLIKNPAPPLTLEQLEAFERRVGVTLPPAYREFISTGHGGQPEPAFIVIRDGDKRWETWVSSFYAIISQSPMWLTIEDCPQWMWDELPHGALPIASTPRLGTFVLFTFDDRHGQVWAKDFDGCDEGDDPEKALYFVATDFNAFLAQLNPFPEDFGKHSKT